jgi:hypothetical protein
MRLLALATMVALVATGCIHAAIGVGLEPAARQATADGLARTLPLLAAKHVDQFYDFGCHALGAREGRFSDGHPADQCGIWVDDLAGVRAFDQPSRDLWSELRRAFDSAGARGMLYAMVDYGSDGQVSSAGFEFGCPGCEFGTLIYERGGYTYGDADSGSDVKTIALGNEWVWHEEDD